MVEINLLPWRQHVFLYQTQRQKKLFLIWIGCCLIFFTVEHATFFYKTQSIQEKIILLRQQLQEIEDSNGDQLSPWQQIEISQNKWRTVLEKISEESFPRIQLIQLDYNPIQMKMKARARSLYDITEWLNHMANLHARVLKIDAVEKGQFQPFSLIIE